MFNIGDTVNIISNDPFWKNKSAIILSNDNNQYKVRSDVGNNHSMIQYFLEEELTASTPIHEEAGLKELSPKKQFKVNHIGRHVVFKGFDYSQYYKKQKSPEGFDYWDDADLAEICLYQDFEGKEGVIEDCLLNDDFNPNNSDEDNFNVCLWKVKFNDNDYSIFGKDLTLMEMNKLTEEFEDMEDFIGDYLTYIDIDGNEIPGWDFAHKIAAAENIDAGYVLEVAKKYHYPCYTLYNGPKVSVMILHKKMDIAKVYSEYIDYLPGSPLLEKI